MVFENSTLLKTGIRWSKRIMWVPMAQRRSKRRGWETKWAEDGYSPWWQIETIPEEVKDAVDSGWFEPGATVLDVGCGNGEIAAWLAQQGFDVLGVDYAGPAIDIAKSQQGETPGSLAYKVVDMCEEAPGVARFNALLDRGCFHNIPKRMRSSYMRNIEAASVPGARLLLFAATLHSTPGERILDVESSFRPLFEIKRMVTTNLAKVPGVAIWMVRK